MDSRKNPLCLSAFVANVFCHEGTKHKDYFPVRLCETLRPLRSLRFHCIKRRGRKDRRESAEGSVIV